MKREIARLVADGLYRDALCLYAQLHSASLRPHKFTFPPLLKACGKLQSAPQAQILHTHLMKTGFSADVYSATALTDAYMKLHLIDDAVKVFEEMPERNLASFECGDYRVSAKWSMAWKCTAWRAFAEWGSSWVLDIFKKMRACTGENPNSVTLLSVLSACASLLYLRFGKQVHGLMMKLKWSLILCLEQHLWTCILSVVVGSWHMNENAVELFEQLESEGFKPDSVTWNSMISGFSQLGKAIEAFVYFRRMQSAGVVQV
ncbi:pentatricopeptide repeat-containing protein [Prunus yedoensis var. nudiflora]|uniref:Pentatricopeptide repeat-containing protein n=1 Tax=Prunus yedoensis var. nudiflora TaxID=2094558 RepID=A0A314URK6_PRUYE|nr:pentatricopeptide repeat-containing protein [Prunus yedoensis var. nudiflora]